MTKSEASKVRMSLESKVIELGTSTRRRDAIIVERTADSLDRILRANEREFAVINLQAASARLRETRAALERLNDGTYGICQECREKISPKRLAALPAAALCIRCQEQVDNEHYFQMAA